MARLRCAPLLCLALALLACRACSESTAWEAATLPNPAKDPEACGRGHVARSWVCDPDGLLTREGGDAAEAVLLAIHRATSRAAASSAKAAAAAGKAAEALPLYPKAPACGSAGTHSIHGYEVAVAVVRRAGGRGSRETRAERLAKGAHDAWGVGDACGSGILLLIAVDDRQAYISTGARAASAASDVALELVLDAMRPRLRAGDLDGAVLHAARDIGEVLAGRLKPHNPWLVWALVVGGIVALLVYNQWNAARKARRYKDVLKSLSKLEQDAARARAQRYAATSCPICFEDFAPEPEEHSNGRDGGGASGSAAAADVAPSSSGEASPPPSPLLRKSLLPCGHAFCAPCLALALAAKPACPICRQPPDGAPPPRPPPPPCNAGAHAAAAGQGFDDYMPELVFRLNRIHQAHPSVVTQGMAQRWASRAHAGGFTTDPALLRADPSLPPTRSGGGGGGGGGGFGGSSGSFGGGSSSGGGGRGGGW